MAFIDSIEQQIPRRPVDNNKRKMFYSGKKKRHTVKTQLMVNCCTSIHG
ncbi:MAG TPA: transposase family protein [Verrucomicrobiae bacterium]|nr:transposase family protein [Verrucomicrobiae bacterium]